MFIEEEDYRTVCSPRELEVLQQADTPTRLRAERVAMEEVASYLRTRYDIDRAYAAIGNERNAHLVQICVNVTLHYLVQCLPQKMASAHRAEQYERTIEWLRLAQAGKVTASLPLAGESDTPSQNSFPCMAGGMKKQTYDW